MDRIETDRLELRVAPANADVGGFQVLVFVDGVEMTVKGAGLGMDPFDVLVPENRLVATAEPRSVPIARCGCGTYGCGSTDVRIRRNGDVVLWDWELEKPMRQGVAFPAAVYDAEVARAGADHSWETPERRAARLVHERVDRQPLAEHGLVLGWVAADHRDAHRLTVSLSEAARYQVFLDVAWDGRTPDALADAVVAQLRQAPQTWAARWLANDRRLTDPPAYAGRGWREVRI